MIRVFKMNLRRTIGDVLITYEELLTIVTQVKMILNSRPLIAQFNSHPGEPEPLTPSHFLTLGPLDSFHSDPRLDAVSKGTVVLLKTENSPPLQWPMSIIEEVMPASDGVVRVVRVRTQNGTYLRPVVKLCVLPSQ